MAKPRGKKGTASSVADAVAGVVTPLGTKAAKELSELEKKLSKARAVEVKRLGKLAGAQAAKGRKSVAKRRRQAEAAAEDVAGLIARIAKRAAATGVAAMESVVGAAGDVAREVGSAAAQAAAAVSPVKSVPRRIRASTARKPAAAKPAAATARKPAAAKPAAAKTKPAAAKPAAATARKPAAAKRAATTPSTRTATTARKPTTTRKPATTATRKPRQPRAKPAPKPDAGSADDTA